MLSKLAQRDPALALAKIEREELHRRDLSHCRLAVAQQLLRSDVTTALELLEKVYGTGWGYPLEGVMQAAYDTDSGVAVAAREPQVAANLWREVNQREPGAQRSILFEGLMKIEALQGGVETVTDAFSRIENSSEGERDRVIKKTAPLLSSGDPDGTIGLIRAYASDDYQSVAVTNVFREWLSKDLGAAGEWLGNEPFSQERDEMVVHFARKVATVDPTSALAWVRKIRDDELRANTMKRVEKIIVDAIERGEE